jgi:hypothetical protein
MVSSVDMAPIVMYNPVVGGWSEDKDFNFRESIAVFSFLAK